MAKKEGKLIANNKKAYHDYFILEKYEAGIVLHGTEVKSLRMGQCSIKEAFIRIENMEFPPKLPYLTHHKNHKNSVHADNVPVLLL